MVSVGSLQFVRCIRQGNGFLCASYWWTDDESIGPLPLAEGQPFLLLQAEHDDGESEHQGLSRASEGNANQVSTCQTIGEHIH